MIRLYFTLGTAVLATLAAVLIWAEPLSTAGPERSEPFVVQASENSGSVLLQWRSSSPLVRSATSGRLDFEDGATSHRDQVDARVLRQGALEYRRRSSEVLLRLSLLKGQDVIGTASVRLTGAPTESVETGR